MNPSHLTPEVTLWVDEVYLDLIAQVLPLMSDAVHVIGVGGPRVAGVDQLARQLEVPRCDDLRQMVNDLPSSYLLLATVDRVASQDILSAMRHGATVLTLEPPADRFEEIPPPPDGYTAQSLSAAGLSLSHADGSQPAISHHQGLLVQTPDFAQSPGWLQAADPLEALGDLYALNFQSLGRAAEGSLWARLNNAWSTLLSLTDLPETVDASLNGSAGRFPQDPRAWTGFLHVHARTHQGPGAVLQISDLSPRSRRSLQIFGSAGSCTIQDQSYQLLNAQGQLLDQSPIAETDLGVSQLIAHQWRRLIDQPPTWRPSMEDHAQQVLAASLACLLSCRTGQPENPGSILQMHRNLT